MTASLFKIHYVQNYVYIAHSVNAIHLKGEVTIKTKHDLAVFHCAL